MLTIRLTRIGKKNQPKYRLVLTDHNFPVKGKFIEILGSFDPRLEKLEIKKERIEYWLKQGSKVSQTVKNLLKKQKIAGKMDVLNRKDRAQTKKKGETEEKKVVPVAKPEEKKEAPKLDNKPETENKKEAPKTEPKTEVKPEAKTEVPQAPLKETDKK